MQRNRKPIVGYLICAFGFTLTLWAFYPGLMSPDSIASLSDGRNGILYDQNSAIMSFVWGGLDQLVAGPALMLVLQLSVFWIAIACLWQAIHRESFATGLALVFVPFMPQILSQLPVIWKDVEMATALLMAVALIYFGKKRNSKSSLLLSPVFLLYAFAARLNSLPAVLPIAIWSGYVAASILELGKARSTPVVVGLSYFVFLLVAAIVLQAALPGSRSSYPFQFVQLYDLAAISIWNNEPRFPSYIVKSGDFSIESLKANYSTTSVGGLVYADQTRHTRPPLVVVDTPEMIRELRTTWRKHVLENPVAYLSHRAGVFVQLIGLGRSVAFQYWDLALVRNPAEFAVAKNPANQLLTSYFAFFQRPVMQTFFFRPFVWILACMYLIYRSLRSRLSGDWDLVLVLSVSSLLYIFSYFFTAPAADYRYVYWPAIASAVAVIFGIYLVRKERTGDQGFADRALAS